MSRMCHSYRGRLPSRTPYLGLEYVLMLREVASKRVMFTMYFEKPLVLLVFLKSFEIVIQEVLWSIRGSYSAI